MNCINGTRECDGCMNCQEQKIILCQRCFDAIDRSYAYLIDDEVLCSECVDDLYCVSLSELKQIIYEE